MKREPVYDGEQLIGHNVHYPASFMTFCDKRGYVSLFQVLPARIVFEPIEAQRRMFDEDD